MRIKKLRKPTKALSNPVEILTGYMQNVILDALFC
jgi:hypothetical protein